MAPNAVNVVPVDPEKPPGTCLCGAPADYVIETAWFRGRRSRDPVCGEHLEAVVGGIKAKLAQRHGC